MPERSGTPLLLAFGLVALGCARGVDGPTSPTPRAPAARKASEPPLQLPADAATQRLALIDRLLFAWDDAQRAGRTAEADALALRLRTTVDGGWADVRGAFEGTRGEEGRYLATMALAFASAPEATGLLVGRLDERDPAWVSNLLTALSVRRDPATPLVPVGRFVAAQHEDVRRAAPLALARVLEARRRAGMAPDAQVEAQVLPHLASMTQSRDGITRLNAARALGELSIPGAAPALLPLLKDGHDRIRVGAAAALARRGDRDGAVEVVRLLNETREPGKAEIAAVLAVYAGALAGAPLPDADRARLGTNAMGWLRWFNEWNAAHPAPPGPPPPGSGSAAPQRG